MTLLVSLVIASFASVVGLKVYSTRRKLRQQTQSRLESNHADNAGKVSRQVGSDLWQPGDTIGMPDGGDIQQVGSDLEAVKSEYESAKDWGEIFLIIISLMTCGPLGLIPLWKTDRLDSHTKKVIVQAYIAITAALIIAALVAAS